MLFIWKRKRETNVNSIVFDSISFLQSNKFLNRGFLNRVNSEFSIYIYSSLPLLLIEENNNNKNEKKLILMKEKRKRGNCI